MKRTKARTRGPKFPPQKVRILGPERANAPRSAESQRKRADVAETTEAPDASTPEKYREFALKHEYLFDGPFAEPFEKIKALPGIKPGKDYDGVPEDELRFELGEIIYLYYRRHNTSGYVDNIKRLMNAVEFAELSMKGVASGILMLDHEHRAMLSEVMGGLVSADVMQGITHIGGSAASQLRVFAEHGNYLTEALCPALMLATGVKPKFRRGRGQPESKYVDVTFRIPTMEITDRETSGNAEGKSSQRYGRVSPAIYRICKTLFEDY
jgi:hypothetical protein